MLSPHIIPFVTATYVQEGSVFVRNFYWKKILFYNGNDFFRLAMVVEISVR
jgi:hypothetical protein